MLRKINENIKLYFKQLFCKHDYKDVENWLVDFGRDKMYEMKCQKCCKIKFKIF